MSPSSRLPGPTIVPTAAAARTNPWSSMAGLRNTPAGSSSRSMAPPAASSGPGIPNPRPAYPRLDLLGRWRGPAPLRRLRPLRLRLRPQDRPVDLRFGAGDASTFTRTSTSPEQQSDSLTTRRHLSRSADSRRPRSREPPASYGDIRAYDTRTGELRWTFHTIPAPANSATNLPKDAWTYTGAATIGRHGRRPQARHRLRADRSAASDFYGATGRRRSVRECLLALDATRNASGISKASSTISGPRLSIAAHPGHRQARWQAGRCRGADHQQGYVYLFDRASGKPCSPSSIVSTRPARSRANWPRKLSPPTKHGAYARHC